MGNNKSMSDKNKLEQNGTEWRALALDQAEQIAGMGSWDYDIDTAEFKWTEGMYRLFNIKSGTKVTPDIYLDFTPKEESDKVNKIVKSIKAEFASFQEMITIIPAGKEKKLVLIKAIVVRDENNKPLRVIGVDLDVTEQRQTEDKINELVKELRRKNRELQSLNSELKTFNTIAATDYKETLRHVYTSLEFIISNDAYNLSNPGKANIRRAQASLQKMNLLTDDIVEYSGIHAPTEAPVEVDLNDLLKVVRDDLEKLVTDTSAIIECQDCPVIFGYPQLLSLLFHHLIENAIKFRKEDGKPVIHVEHLTKQGAEIEYTSAEADKTYNVISVKDNGDGFNQEEAEKIFEMFSRLHQKGKYKGSGIGLAICKKIMDIHGGFITASAEEGKGAAFSCYFPLQNN
jgi:signal transduction histidine kinase